MHLISFTQLCLKSNCGCSKSQITDHTVEDWKLVENRRTPRVHQQSKGQGNVLAKEKGNALVNVCNKKEIGKEKGQMSGNSGLGLF